MSTVTDQIVSAGIELGEQIAGNISNWQAQEQAMREMIAAALAEAQREGAEAMRESAAIAAWSSGMDQHNRRRGIPHEAREVGSVCAQAIRALPLPTGERQAVPDPVELLRSLGPKPWETSPEAHAQARLISDFADALANNLEVRRG